MTTTPEAVLTELTKFAARTDVRVDQLANVSSESCQRIDNLATLSTDVCRRLVDTRGEQSLHRMALDEHGERIAALAAQLAGLQRLVESLVNERGEGRLEELADRITTIADEAFGLFPVQSADESLTAIERGIVGLRAEVARLTRERDALAARLEDRDAVVADIVKRTAEKIAAWLTAKSQHHEQRKSQLMSHDDSDSQAIRNSIDEHGWAESYAEVWAADIRAGTWKEQP